MGSEYPVRGPQQLMVEAEGPRFVGYAGFITRLMAMVVDLLIIFVIWIFGGIALNFFVQTSGISELSKLLDELTVWIIPIRQTIFGILVELTSLLGLSQIYFTFFYSFGGASIGKHLMGLRVVRADGRPLKPARAALRTLAYALSTAVLYAGFFNVLLDDRRRAWHDLLTGTVVVHSWRPYSGADGEGR
jgi:uncharacterized RDD family membrane protein YckC